MPCAPVSVIVRSYNCGQFIRECLESILNQTVQPEQIVIVDDGSTDDTEQVVNRFEDSRIVYIKQQNAGVSAARNAGLNAARGEFVAFLDADDRWRPTFVERMREFLVAFPSSVCVFANFVRFDHAIGEVLGDQFQYYPRLRQPELSDEIPSVAARYLPKSMAFSMLVTFDEIPAYTQVMMFRRSLIESISFDTSLRMCEDAHFALRAFMRGDVIYTSEVLCEVRHDSNATRNPDEISIHKLASLKSLQPYVTGTDEIAYRIRMVKAHIDAALYQTKTGRIRPGLRTYVEGLRVPGSARRKFKGLVRLALALPHGLANARRRTIDRGISASVLEQSP